MVLLFPSKCRHRLPPDQGPPTTAPSSNRLTTMALELFSESWAGWPAASSPAPTPVAATSPRISFSRDLDSSSSTTATLDHHRQHQHQQRSDSSLLDSSSPDFDFCVSRDLPEQYHSSAADELFSDGFLLPVPLLLLPRGGAGVGAALSLHPSLPITTPIATSSSSVSSSSNSRPVRPPPTPQAEERKSSVEEVAMGEKPAAGKQPSSFWRFGRSSSLNCSESSGSSGGGRRASLICSLPLLSRSKSTGSNPSTPTLKQRQQPFNTASAVSAMAAAAASNSSNSASKLSRKGSGNGGAAARNPYYYGQHHQGGGGVRISPVLNVPPPYIPKGSGAGLFSFGHLLCSSSRERSRKKTTQPHTPP